MFDEQDGFGDIFTIFLPSFIVIFSKYVKHSFSHRCSFWSARPLYLRPLSVLDFSLISCVVSNGSFPVMSIVLIFIICMLANDGAPHPEVNPVQYFQLTNAVSFFNYLVKEY